jgi:two-component system OmpR family response regulator
MKVLLVEDNPRVATFVKKGLTEAGHVIDHAANGRDGLFLASSETYDAIIMDRMLPGGIDGLGIITALRAADNATPILILSALSDVDERIRGLRSGGDDYLVKPFAFEELSARLRAMARRSTDPRGQRRTVPNLTAGAIALDETARRVTVGQTPVELSPREFSLLECLLRHVGQTLTRDQLLDQAWPFGVAVTPNAVDAYVHYLRDKLGSAGQQIETVRGVGYRLADA